MMNGTRVRKRWTDEEDGKLMRFARQMPNLADAVEYMAAELDRTESGIALRLERLGFDITGVWKAIGERNKARTAPRAG